LYTLDMAFLPSNSEGCRNPAALFYSGLAGVRLVPEAELNQGNLNISYGESRRSESRHQGRESALSSHLRNLTSS